MKMEEEEEKIAIFSIGDDLATLTPCRVVIKLYTSPAGLEVCVCRAADLIMNQQLLQTKICPIFPYPHGDRIKGVLFYHMYAYLLKITTHIGCCT